LGYLWSNTDHKIFDRFGDLEVVPFRYIFIGRMVNNVLQLDSNKIVHEDDLEWMEEYGLDKLIYTT